jgi:hypothetical protein
MPVFPKTAGILKLISYWLKIQKAASAILKQFPKAAGTQIINFLKAAGLDNTLQIYSKFCSSFQKPVIVGTSCVGQEESEPAGLPQEVEEV